MPRTGPASIAPCLSFASGGNRTRDATAHSQRTTPPAPTPLPLRVGTRGSPLALVQTRAFLDRLPHFCPVLRALDVFEEHQIRTTGDAVQDRPLAEIGGKGLFAKEIHEALADGRIDFAVHSLKDLETELPPGIVLACTLRREDARDALILGPGLRRPDPADPLGGPAAGRGDRLLLGPPPGAAAACAAGSSHPPAARQRADPAGHASPPGDCAASLLALAGLQRLGLEDRASVVLDPDAMVPAAGQGIVGVTVRADDTELARTARRHRGPGGEGGRRRRAGDAGRRSTAPAARRSAATPACCRTGELQLTGLVARADGSFLLKRSAHGPARATRRGLAPSLAPACGRHRRRTSLPDRRRRGAVTRPEPGASETAGRVAAMGLSPVVAPLLMIEHLPCKLPEPTELSAVLVTSGNAVPALPPGWHGVRLFAVGDATARQARHAGFASVESADGDGDALAALVARRVPPGAGPILLASGEGQGEALAEALRRAWFRCHAPGGLRRPPRAEAP